jgi:nucleoside-diphosphate-sugar epimerase
MRIFLTGATGYLGRALALRLRTEGHSVAALVRPKPGTHPRRQARLDELVALGVALHAGDLTDRVSMREGMSGADWVIHAAAELDLAADAERMAAANVQGSENVASLAWKLGVPHLLALSSIARFGGSPDDGSPATEESPPYLPYATRYDSTKAAGEAAIAGWAKRGLAVHTVYPSLVYGPPGKRSGANALLAQLDRGAFPALVGADRRSSWIFLDDLIEGIVRVMARGPAGRGYLLAGDVTTTRELARKVEALGGARAPRFELPIPAMRALLAAAAPFYRLRGRRLPIPPAQLASLDRHWAFDDSRARRELDWRPRTLDEGLPPTLEHLRRVGGA